jgi:hypothetical protein
MSNPEDSAGHPLRRRSTIEAVVASVLILLGLFAIGASDVSPSATRNYWTLLVAIFAAITLVSGWMHGDHRVARLPGVLAIGLHWLGVFLAIQLVYYFVASGRMANADVGLTNGLIMALGVYLFGAHGNWRFIVIGLSLAGATAGVAFMEEYLWILFGIAVLAILVIVIGARVVKRDSMSSTASP